MLDVNFIRDNPEAVKKGIESKGVDPKLVDNFLDLDKEWRKGIRNFEERQAELNKLSKERNIERAKEVKKDVKTAEEKVRQSTKKRDALLLEFPNVPFPDWPVGKDDKGNVVLRKVGKKPDFKFEPKDYLTLAESLGIIDIKRAARVAGTRFGYLMGGAALLELALIQYTFSTLTKKGFIPVIPPAMARPEILRPR